MKHLYLFICFFITCFTAHTQITSVDTVCTGVPMSLTGPANAITYTWSFDTVNINQTLPNTVVAYSGNPINTPNGITMQVDNGNYYCFVVNNNAGLVRLSYGTNPNGTPTVTNLGSLSGALTTSQTQGIDIAKEGSNWYGFITDNTTLVRLNFGTSLANTPTTTSMSYTSNLSWPHQFTLKKYGTNWIAFAANRGNDALTRFDFGSSLTNTPSASNLTSSTISQPCNFAIYQESGNWYMLVNNLLGSVGATITRVSFGSNLQNNSPSYTNLGNPGGFYGIPRTVNIVTDCNQLYALATNENTNIVKLNFSGASITGSFTATNLGSLGSSSGRLGGSCTYWYKDSLYFLYTSFNNSNLYRLKVLTVPPFDTTIYYSNTYTHTFTTPGTYNVTLYTDQGDPSGPAAYCKTIYVGEGDPLKDVISCSSPVVLNASTTNGTSYLWNTSATSPAIAVSSSGKYWVTITGAICITSDTANVTISSPPTVALGNDTTFCYVSSTTLQNTLANPSGATYLWNTGATTASLTTSTSGTYWLRVTKNGCSGTDTIQVNFAGLPAVNLGPDTGYCTGGNITLQNYGSGTGSYLWNTSSTATSISVNTSGTYWLRIQSAAGCINSDTVIVTSKPVPNVSLGVDTSICSGNNITLANKLSTLPGSTYLWNTSANTATISTSSGGNYWLRLTTNGCSASDTMQLTILPLPNVNLGPDTAICQNGNITLQDYGLGSASYLWNTGSTATTLNVTPPAGKFWLKGQSSAGCVATDTVQVNVKTLPTVELGNDTTICGGTSLLLKNLLTNPLSPVFLWNTGATTATISATLSTKYWLNVTGSNGCSSSDSITVVFKPLPNVNLGNDTSFCDGKFVTLTNLSSAPGYANTWNTGSTSGFINVANAGKYWLSVSLSGCTNSDTVNISVRPVPVVALGADTSLCNGDSIELKNKAPYLAGSSYLWNTASTAANIYASTAGLYWLQVTVNNCENRDSVTVAFKPRPYVFIGNDTAICENHTLTLQSNPQAAGSTYLWNTGSNLDNFTINKKGYYNLTVTTDGCSSSDGINIDNLLLPVIDLGSDRNLCVGEKVTLSPIGIEGLNPTYKWSDGSTNNILTVSSSGIYSLHIENVCGADDDEVNVTFRNCKLFFPSAFTPNGDSRNDLAKMTGDIYSISKYALSIYNRWGQLVFHTTDPTQGWNGMFNAAPAEVGTYYYYINLTYLGQEELMKGDIALIR